MEKKPPPPQTPAQLRPLQPELSNEPRPVDEHSEADAADYGAVQRHRDSEPPADRKESTYLGRRTKVLGNKGKNRFFHPPKTVSTLRRTLETALTATPEEIENHLWDAIDIAIAESLLEHGDADVTVLASRVGLTQEQLRHRMRDPVRCGWISRQMYHTIPVRLGHVYAALFRSAVGGNVNSARLLLERFDDFFRPAARAAVHINVGAGGNVDVKNMSDQELGQRIQLLMEDLNDPTASRDKDSEDQGGEGDSAQDPGGTVPPAARESDPLLEAARTATDVPYELSEAPLRDLGEPDGQDDDGGP